MQGHVEITRAFAERKRKRAGRHETDGKGLFVFNNLVAYWTYEGEYGLPEGSLRWTMSNHGTHTTRKYLNAVFTELKLPFRVFQKGHNQYLWHMGRDEERQINTAHTYTVDRFEIEVMKRSHNPAR